MARRRHPGPSGSGKTTLLNVVSTIDTPTSGRVRVGGQELTGLKRRELARFRRERLGFIANRVIIKKRSRELGTYLLLGMEQGEGVKGGRIEGGLSGRRGWGCSWPGSCVGRWGMGSVWSRRRGGGPGGASSFRRGGC